MSLVDEQAVPDELQSALFPLLPRVEVSQVFSLDESLAVGLMLVSLAAGAPALPKTAVFAKVDAAAATDRGACVAYVRILAATARLVIAPA